MPSLATLHRLTDELSLPRLFWGVAAVGEAAPLFLPEQASIARAVPRRRAEFTAGRAAARKALAAMGRPVEAIPMGADRAPVWPRGLCGSISHAAGLAVAVLAEAPARIGVDIERDAPVADDLVSEICRPEERALVPRARQGLFARRVFSAKEAVYKAEYPETGLIFGFHALEVDLEKGCARYTDHRDLDTLPTESRQILPVAQRRQDGLILSLSIRFD